MNKTLNLFLDHWQLLLAGAFKTTQLSIVIIILGTIVGSFFLLVIKAQIPLFSNLVFVFLELVRSLPSLVILFWIYYSLPIIWQVEIDSESALILSLTLILSCFVYDCLKAALESIPRSEWELATILGLKRRYILGIVILPQILLLATPTLLSSYISITKMTVLGSLIAVPDLAYTVSVIISNTTLPMEAYTILGLIFVVIIVPPSLLTKYVTSRIQKLYPNM